MCFGIHSQPGPCSFCSNLQGRGWWLRSHLIINAGAVKLCHRSRPLGYCWSEALSKQNDSDWDSSLLREAMLVLIGLTFSDCSFVRLASIPVQDKGKLVRLVTYFSILSHELCCKALIKCWLPGWTSSQCTQQMSHFTTREKYAEPQAGFTLELPPWFQWMQMPLPSLSSLINKRYFHLYRCLIPLGTTSPQADNYKPLNDSVI